MSGFGNYDIQWRSDNYGHIDNIIKMALTHYGTEDNHDDQLFTHHRITINTQTLGQKLEFLYLSSHEIVENSIISPIYPSTISTFIKDWLGIAKYPVLLNDVKLFIDNEKKQHEFKYIKGYWIKFNSYVGLTIETDWQIYPI